MANTTDMQTAAANYEQLADALRAKLQMMTAEFEKLSFEQQYSITGLVMAAAASGVEKALRSAQEQLRIVLADMAPERDT